MKPPRGTDVHMQAPHGQPQSSAPEVSRSDFQQVLKVLSNISFGTVTTNADPSQNMDVWHVNVPDTGLVNTEFAVTHRLGRVPIGYIVIGQTLAGVTFNSGTAWTATQIFLKCNIAHNNLQLMIL